MLRVRRGVLLLAAIATCVLAGCGSGDGHTQKMAARPPAPESEEFTPAPRKPTRRRGPILAGEVRPIVAGSGEEAWASGRKIYLTADDGRTWRGVAPVDIHGFVGADFIDPDHGWVVAATSTRHPHLAIYATSDGGFTWTEGVAQHPRQLSIVSVPLSFVDRRVGYALVDPMHSSGVEVGGSLNRTEDGGAHWDRAGETPVDGSIDFTGPRRGWLVGGLKNTLWHTEDGGRHWRPVRVDPPPGDGYRLRYGMPARVSGGREVLPVLLEGSPTRIAFYERVSSGWRPVYVDTLVGTIGGGLGASVSDRPPDGFVVSDPGERALKLIRFDRAGRASARVLPARGLPAGATVQFADARHGFATPCQGCEHPGTQHYVSVDGGRTWERRPYRLRWSAALEAAPRCAPGKLLVYQSEKGGVGLGSVYTSLTIENLSESRVVRPQRLVIEALREHQTGTEVLDDDVRLAGTAAQLAEPSSGRHVDGDAPLVAIDRLEVGRITTVVIRRTPGAGFVSHPGPLDLGHLGTEVGEHHGCEGPRKDAREVEDAQGAQCGIPVG